MSSRQEAQRSKSCWIESTKQENPGIKSRGYQEPKTKIYETFYLQPSIMATGLYDKNRCKNTIIFKNRNHFSPQNGLFFHLLENHSNYFILPIQFSHSINWQNAFFRLLS